MAQPQFFQVYASPKPGGWPNKRQELNRNGYMPGFIKPSANQAALDRASFKVVKGVQSEKGNSFSFIDYRGRYMTGKHWGYMWFEKRGGKGVHAFTFDEQRKLYNPNVYTPTWTGWLQTFVIGEGDPYKAGPARPVPTPPPTMSPTAAPTSAPTLNPTPVPTDACRKCVLDLGQVETPDLDRSVQDFVTLPPGQLVKFSNACTVGSESVDLVMTTVTPWSTKPKMATIVHGSMFRLNVQSNTSVEVEFKLVQKGTTVSVAAEELVFSVLDADAEEVSKQRRANVQSVIATGYAAEVHGAQIAKIGDTFAAAATGSYWNNPTSPFGLNGPQKDVAIAFKYTDLSKWRMTFEMRNKVRLPQGRAFFLTGSSDLMGASSC